MRLTRWYIVLLMLTPLCPSAQVLTPEALDTCKVYSDLTRAMLKPNEVYRLDLTKTKLKEFPPEIYLFSNLQELRLDRNKISEVPDRIGELRKLQILSMEKNKLEVFSPAVCRLENLRILNLANNEITRIPDDIGKLQQLEELILWSNLIGYYPDSLSELPKLKVVDLLNIEMNAQEQERVRTLLPNAEISFSPPCDCVFQDPWDPDYDEKE